MPSARKRMRSLYERAHVTRRASDPAPFRAVPAFAPACGFRLCFCTKKIQNRPEYQMRPYSHADVRQTLKFLCKMAKIIYFAILLLYNMNKLRPACRSYRQKQLTPCGRDCRKGDLPQKHASDSMDSRTSGHFDSGQGILPTCSAYSHRQMFLRPSPNAAINYEREGSS